MTEEQKGTDTNANEQKSGKTFTQEELDKIIDKRLERERKKYEQAQADMSAKIDELMKQKQGTDEKLTEAQEIQKALEEMKQLKANAEALAEQERLGREKEKFEKEIIKYANKFEIDSDKALEFFNDTNVRKDEAGNYDFEATFSGFKEAFGTSKKKDVGTPPQGQPPQTKKRSDMSVTERVEYQTKYGIDAYNKLPY